jgi:hypothetical protein
MLYISDDNLIDTKDYLSLGKIETFQLGKVFVYRLEKEPGIYRFSMDKQLVVYSHIKSCPKILVSYSPF